MILVFKEVTVTIPDEKAVQYTESIQKGASLAELARDAFFLGATPRPNGYEEGEYLRLIIDDVKFTLQERATMPQVKNK